LTVGSLALATTWEEEYIKNANWCPGIAAANIQAMHPAWHMMFMPIGLYGKDFVEFHREFIAEADDARLYGFGTFGPTAAAIPVVPQPGSILKFDHTSLNTYTRPAGHAIDSVHGGPGALSSWTIRPANLRLRNATFHGYTASDVGAAFDALPTLFHGNGHVSVGLHDKVNAASLSRGDMNSIADAPRDGAFFQWHKEIDTVYAEWAVGQYQLVGNTGLPIYFGVGSAAVGAAGSSLNERRQATVYQGKIPIGADQYGASPRIASDVYVGNNDNKNLLYQYGIRQWNTLNAWDRDDLTILNPQGNGWYFSVTPASVGLPGTAVNAQLVRGGDVFESAGTGTNTLFRAETALGLVAAVSDNLDALEVDQEKRIRATNDNATPGVYDRTKQWFTLRSGTMFGLKALGGATVAASDILQFNGNGDLVIAVSGAMLGLGATDDLDALVIVDTVPLDVLNGTDRVYYSLAAGSPALGGDSPADVFCHTVGGATCGSLGGRLEKRAADLGLAATDDLDALDVRESATGTGACCHSAGTCTQVSQASCVAAGDVFSGPETVCAAAECPSVPGACCHPDGSCTSTSDVACLSVGGNFKGVAVACTVGLCPAAPPNDECANAYQIPYDYPNNYEPPPAYRDNTYATSANYDPPYSCADHNVFFPEYGSGTVWYYYDVPAGPGPRRSIGVTTVATYDNYASGGYAADTRLALYYSPSGNCSTLNEYGCNDNNYTGGYNPPNPPYGGYARVQCTAPQPGRYYVQLSTVGDVNRGQIRLQVYDPTPVGVPTFSQWGIIVLVLGLLGFAVLVLRRMVHA